ncbi:MAG TPA: sulfotransferase [Thermoanaerobaculia bacterium]|nr:sulfotransferase [Thermoanaerobaculia bacterium]
MLAHSFSGSTLLSFLLGAHPEIATIGEMFIAEGIDPETYVCSCGRRIAECPFFQEMSREMAARGIPFDIRRPGLEVRQTSQGLAQRVIAAEPRGPLLEAARGVALRLLPGAHKALTETLRRNQAAVEVITGLQGGRAFVDSSKRPGRLLHLRRIPSFDVRVIHLVRDPRAVACSSMKNVGRTAEQGARSWVDSAQLAERSRHGIPDERWLTVRYEDLCGDPDAALDRIWRFIGVKSGFRVPDFRAFEHHIIGNRMRLSATSEIRPDERWKTVLTPEQVRAVDAITGETAARHGYTRG